jgi:hypothetical protein
MKKLVVIGLSVLALAGCRGPATLEPMTDFDANAASIINKKGSGTVSGQAFLKQAGGGVVTCAGNEVALIPATDYATQRLRMIFGSSDYGYKDQFTQDVTKAKNGSYYEMRRYAVCDAQGNFVFKEVASGTYYLMTSVLWSVTQYRNAGGSLMHKVEVKNGRNSEVLMTDKFIDDA